MYVDVLKAPSILSLALQEEFLDTVQGMKGILQAVPFNHLTTRIRANDQLWNWCFLELDMTMYIKEYPFEIAKQPFLFATSKLKPIWTTLVTPLSSVFHGQI